MLFSDSAPEKVWPLWSVRTSVDIADSLASGFAFRPSNDMSVIFRTYDGFIGNCHNYIPSVRYPEMYVQRMPSRTCISPKSWFRIELRLRCS